VRQPSLDGPKSRKLGMDVYGFLMMYRIAEPGDLARQAKLAEDYGVHCVYVADNGRLSIFS
jgi:4-hydroxy 2-oxovalerate aldolase